MSCWSKMMWRWPTCCAAGLVQAGFAVDHAADGQEASDKAYRVPYEVVVHDRDVPKVHCDDVCRRLIAAGSAARILMLTASGEVGAPPGRGCGDRAQVRDSPADELGVGVTGSELQPAATSQPPYGQPPATAQPAYGQPARRTTPECANPWRQIVGSSFMAVVIMSSGIAGLNALVHHLTS